MAGRWARLTLYGVGSLLAVFVLVTGLLFAPVLRDDWALDRVVRVVALEWRDFGREAALARLQFELDAQAIGHYVADEDCSLDDREGPLRVVRCQWHTEVVIPGTRWSVPVTFASQARIDADGQLR